MKSSITLTFIRRLQTSSPVLSKVRGPVIMDGFYPRDYKPSGVYPETEEERKAAAIKYGMRPEDYRPIDKDDLRYVGDYPDAGTITYDHKDPYENWTDRMHRRNWGEIAQIDRARYQGDRYTFTGLEQEEFSFWRVTKLFARFLIPVAFFMWIGTRGERLRFHWKNPAMPKQYSYDYYRAFPFEDPRRYPIVNYTFDPVD